MEVSDADAMSTEAEGVDVVAVLPKYSSKLVPIGEVVEVLVGLRNGGNDALNATHIWGTLSNENFVQNLTAQPLGDFYRTGVVVEEGKEASFQYRFMPAVQLPPGPYQVALNVGYESGDGEFFYNTFFNSTIELVEKTVRFVVLCGRGSHQPQFANYRS